MTKPNTAPVRPEFSSGPCAKRPGWTQDALKNASLGRSHRSKPGKSKLKYAIEKTRDVLRVPDSHIIGIVPGSDTGAVEMALWSLLGARGVDMLAWESFGAGWVTDVAKQLKLDDVNIYTSDYGFLPDLSKVDCDRDVVFTWNGTTSGVKVPNADWIADDRAGLTICDATSAAFAMDLPFEKLDVVTYSWQKVLGGEGAHGVIILSKRAVERLETYTPTWPMPKIFRLTKGGKLISGIFEGETINTPSMLCVEDYIDALEWADSIGGLEGLIRKSESNLKVIEDWVASSSWAGFLAAEQQTRSNTSVCIKVIDPWMNDLSVEDQAAVPKKLASLLDAEGVAFDIGGYRDAPPGLRIWAGATVNSSDLEALMPWLDWAYGEVKASFS